MCYIQLKAENRKYQLASCGLLVRTVYFAYSVLAPKLDAVWCVVANLNSVAEGSNSHGGFSVGG